MTNSRKKKVVFCVAGSSGWPHQVFGKLHWSLDYFYLFNCFFYRRASLSYKFGRQVAPLAHDGPIVIDIILLV